MTAVVDWNPSIYTTEIAMILSHFTMPMMKAIILDLLTSMESIDII
jgi:hypothetical protein